MLFANFVQTLCSQSGAAGGDASSLDLEAGAAGSALTAANRRTTASDVTERKYEQLYEDKVNPFKQFRERQAEERYRNLSVRSLLVCLKLIVQLRQVSEKAVYNIGQLVFSKKGARTFVFVYALTLHLLVFGTLWMHTVNPHC